MGNCAHRFGNLPALCVVAVFATSCASDQTMFIRSNGTRPEPRQLAAVNAACSHPGPSVGGFVGGAAAGAAGGLYVGTAWGASQAGPIGAAAGAGLGLLVGMVGGAADSIPPDDYDLCMARNGYQRVDPEQAAALRPGDPTR